MHTQKKLDERENKAVEKIKTDPNFFYSFAKSLVKIKSTINMLIDSNQDITTDPQKMTFCRSSSVRCLAILNFRSPLIQHSQESEHFKFSDGDIVSAITSVPPVSASGPNGVPSILLKNCAAQLG